MKYAQSHCAGTRQHVADRVRMLSSKNYAAQFAQAPQFVVLFLPGDQFLSAALDQQPDLLDRAMSSNIILTTPSTLLALLKAVHSGWQNMRLAENAERIRSLAEDLYARLATFRNHMGKIGGSLEVELARIQCGRGITRTQRAAGCPQVRGTWRSRRQANRRACRDRSQRSHRRGHDAPAHLARRALSGD